MEGARAQKRVLGWLRNTVDPRKRLDRGISCVTSWWRAVIRDLASGTDKFHLVSRLTSYGEDARRAERRDKGCHKINLSIVFALHNTNKLAVLRTDENDSIETLEVKNSFLMAHRIIFFFFRRKSSSKVFNAILPGNFFRINRYNSVKLYLKKRKFCIVTSNKKL